MSSGTNSERILQNNEELQQIKQIIDAVPERGNVDIPINEDEDTVLDSGFYASVTSEALLKDASYRNATKLAGLILEGVDLPSEYEQLEYLESTGTQYLQLDFPEVDTTIQQDTYDFSMDAQFTSLDTDITNYNLIGVGSKTGGSIFSTNAMLYAGWQVDGNNKVWSYSNGDNDDWVTSTNADTNRHYFFISSSIDSSKKGLYVDGTRVGTGGPTVTRCTYNYPFTLFGYKNSSGFRGTRVKIYRLTLGWVLEDPTVDLIPVKRKNDGVLGMYDIARGIFFTNQGTGTFLYGEF